MALSAGPGLPLEMSALQVVDLAKAGPSRDVRFRAVLAPGAPELTADQALVAVRGSQHALRFQNYRAHFTIPGYRCRDPIMD